ncbi:potassium transporter Kef [Hahella sp. CCB-MM4]|nr:potassium transporter Kef [Hahella sp. CCB-MM4]
MVDSDTNDALWQSGNACSLTDLREALECRAQTGNPMVGFILPRANLEGINLVRPNARQGYQLIDSDLYRANLKNAHCFKLDFSGSSLMKADFEYANLHCANLKGCNLLGTKFKHAKIEQVEWGEEILQEQQAREAETHEAAMDLYEQAEEVYRHLRKVCEDQGLFENAGRFFQKEMIMRRMQLPYISFKRLISKIVDLFCGYGEQPLRVIIFSLLVILSFATLYFFAGLSFSGESLGFKTHLSIRENVHAFLSSLYFSVVTFTTLGYGDLAPIGIARGFAALEAFIGSFTLALFVVVFVKKMTR